MLPAVRYFMTLCVNQFMVYDLHCPVLEAIHSLHPQHLTLRFELFCHALTLHRLLCQQEHLLRCLFVDVGKADIQLAAGQQFRMQGLTLLLDVAVGAAVPISRWAFLLRLILSGRKWNSHLATYTINGCFYRSCTFPL